MSSAGLAALLRVEMLPVLSRLPAYSRLAWAVVRDPRVAPAPKALVLLDADLGRVGRSGRLVTRTALRAGGRAVAGLGRSLWRLSRRLVG